MPAPTVASNAALDFLTGRNYGVVQAQLDPRLRDDAAFIDDTDADQQPPPAKKRRVLLPKFKCPAAKCLPDTACDFVFKRVYDVERHLKGIHDVHLSRDDVLLLLGESSGGQRAGSQVSTE